MSEAERSMDETMSGLRAYAIGVVVHDKPARIDDILVAPLEKMTMEKGNLRDTEKNFDTTSTDAQGVLKSNSVKGGSYLRAKWLPMGNSNRMTAPDVRANESVMIYSYKDTDDYYWTTIFREPSLRRLERVVWAFGNLPSGRTPFDEDSSYTVEFDTISKRIAITTSKSDGESFKYMIEINPGNSTLTVTDNVGNSLGIESEANNVYLRDASGGSLDTRSGSPIIKGPGGITLDGDTVISGSLSTSGVTTMSGTLNAQDANFSGSANFAGYVNLAGGHGPHP